MATKYVYLCIRRKPNSSGFKELMWLDEPCKGWRIIEKTQAHFKNSGLRC